MRSFLILSVLAMTTLPACAKDASQSYWLLQKSDGHTWCGYRNPTEFNADAAKLRPTESIRVTYSAHRLTELTRQIDSESGDWIVIDKYVPVDNGLSLTRVNLLAQQKLEIVQKTAIHRGKPNPLHIVDVKALGTMKTIENANLSKIDYPPVQIITDLYQLPAMVVISAMRKQAVRVLCKNVQ